MPTGGLVPLLWRRKKKPERKGPTIFSIIAAFPARNALMRLLSAFDCAKFDVALGGILDAGEKDTYLDYARDLFWHESDIHCLRRQGLELLLLGKDVSAMKRRLRRPDDATFGKKRLRIYVVGLFPLHGRPTELVRKALETSIEPTPSILRMRHDQYMLDEMLARSEIALWKAKPYFMLSFAVPMALGRRDAYGSWHSVSRSPDTFVELHTYIPSFQDRWYAVVDLPPSVAARVVRGTSTRRAFASRLAAVKAYLGCLCVQDLCYSWESWRRTKNGVVFPIGSIFLEFTPFSLHIEILF